MLDLPVKPTIDLDAEGKQHGFLRLPYSRDDSAWGSVMIPVAVVKNGEGPTALLTGANHGDEFEGPLALFELANRLEPEMVQGRVIIVPAFNYPAFVAGRRTSPIDDGNLNRCFPGRPDGIITEKIADFFTRYMVPLADYVLDFHSGGKTLDFLPYAAYHVLEDKTQEAACRAAAAAFNAPYTMAMLEIDAATMYDTAVENQGKVFVTTELAGGGSVTARSVDIARRGLKNFLIHAGICTGDIALRPSTWLDMPSQSCFVFSEADGLYEPVVDLGDQVKAGDVVARVWSMARTGLKPLEFHALIDGIVATRHFPGMVKCGDCLTAVAAIIDPDAEPVREDEDL